MTGYVLPFRQHIKKNMRETPTQQFIEDAIAGGWNNNYGFNLKTEEWEVLHAMLLEPFAWQAVGKTRGWNPEIDNSGFRKKIMGRYLPVWRYEMHRFIDHLADSKTIDEALQAIE